MGNGTGSTRVVLGLGVAALVALAFVAGRVTAPEAELTERPPGPRDTALEPGISDARPDVTDARDDPTPSTRERARTHEGEKSAAEWLRELVPDAGDARLAEADAQAESIRLSAQGQSQRSNATAARAVAEAIRKERAFLADQARGGTMAMLRELSGAKVRPFALVEDPAAFAGHFERTIEGAELDGTAHRGQEPPASGTVLRFPSGLHTLHVSQWGRGGDFPEDLIIEGAGRDATIVRFDEFSARGMVRNLTFRNLTVDAGDDYLTDHRGEAPTTIRMESCRVIGFDKGAGGSVMLAARTAAFYASDTLFEGGYGRSPGSGNLFRVRSGLLARMERCTFTGPLSSVYDTNAAATYVFDACKFENVKVPLDNPPAGVRFVDCEMLEVSADDILARKVQWPVDGMLPAESDALVVDGVAGMIPDGTTGPVAIAYPAGVHDLSVQQKTGAHRGPLVVRGQGKDATLLRMNGRFSNDVVVVRDATIDVRSSGLFSGQSRVLLLERVRLIRWDSGAGGSTAIDRRDGGIVVVRDSEIIDGFGRSPGRGTVAYLHNGATLRFERCRVDLVGSKFSGYSGTLVLSDTTVNGIAADEAERLAKSAVLVRSTLNPRPAPDPKGGDPRPETRPLSDLNSAWDEKR